MKASAREVHIATIVRNLSARQCEAWLACGRRIADGMPAADAEVLMWRELADEGKGGDRLDVLQKPTPRVVK